MGETLAGILAAEPSPGERVYLCAFDGDGERCWLALDGAGGADRDRRVVLDAASIAALCEVAEETAAGGDLDDLVSRLVAVRITEAPAGIEEAEEAARDLAAHDRASAAPRIPGLPRPVGRGDAPARARARRGRLAVRRGDEAGNGGGRELTQEIEEKYKGELS